MSSMPIKPICFCFQQGKTPDGGKAFSMGHCEFNLSNNWLITNIIPVSMFVVKAVLSSGKNRVYCAYIQIE